MTYYLDIELDVDLSQREGHMNVSAIAVLLEVVPLHGDIPARDGAATRAVHVLNGQLRAAACGLAHSIHTDPFENIGNKKSTS